MQTIEKGHYYRLSLPYGNWENVIAVKPTGARVAILGANGITPAGDQWQAIDEDGEHMHLIAATSIGRSGIGGLEPLNHPPADDEGIRTLLAKHKIVAAKRQEDQRREQEEWRRKRQEEQEKLPSQYPYLVTKANAGNKSHHALAAANIRRELKRAFPGVKFSVRSESFAGGTGIDIHWTDGPTTEQVEEITAKYQEGMFDGMTDCYNYDVTPFNDVFGGAKYVTPTRRETLAGIREAWRRAGNDPNEIIANEKGNWDRWAQKELGDLIFRTWSTTDLR